MLKQTKEKWQIRRIYAFFIQGEDVFFLRPRWRFHRHKIVRILNPLRNTHGKIKRSHIVGLLQMRRDLFIRKLRVDGHNAASSSPSIACHFFAHGPHFLLAAHPQSSYP